MNPIDAPDAQALAAAQIINLFPSPVMVCDWPDGGVLCRSLSEVVHQRRRRSAGVVKTNRGGWQSDTDLQDWGDAATTELQRRIGRMAQAYVERQSGCAEPVFGSGWKLRAWANINEHGHFNRSHDHLGRYSFVSGIFYVDVGDIESGQVAGGRTRFEDRSHVAIDIHDDGDVLRRDCFMDPRNGRMVLFPAGLMHAVEPYQGHAQRITIAFNLYHPALAVPRLDEYLQQADWWWVNFRGLVLLQRKLPEKLHALKLLPGELLRQRRSPAAGGLLAMAWARATAQAAETFQARRKA